MSNKTKIGTIITQDLPQLSSLLAEIGFDFIFIDLEHGQVSDQSIAAIILSKKNCQVFIRIREISEATIKHALDLGCDGLIAPRLETIQELTTLVDSSYYPPIGKRSVGFSLANQFGINFKNYTQQFKPVLLAQIESVQGLSIKEDIISHELIDGIFMGPYDLSMSIQLPGEFDNEDFKTAVNSVRSTCQKNNKLFGTFSTNVEAAQQEIDNGCEFIAIGVDSHIQLMAYQNIITSVN